MLQLSLNYSPLLPLFSAELLFLRGRRENTPDHPSSRKDDSRVGITMSNVLLTNDVKPLPYFSPSTRVGESGQGRSGGWPTGQWGDIILHRGDNSHTYIVANMHACTHMHMHTYVRIHKHAQADIFNKFSLHYMSFSYISQRLPHLIFLN